LGTSLQELLANVYRRTIQVQAALLVATVVPAIFGAFSSSNAQTPIIAGYRDFHYGMAVFEAPTAEKPESKLWWNDGFWWGSLWHPASNKYRIHRFDLSTQSWIDVGPDIEDRPKSLADALWDGQKLYIASHVYGGGSQQRSNTTAANSARLYRYSYDTVAKIYSLDAGFPVLVNSVKSETLVLDKDSTGRLWVSWTQANKVYLNRSLGDDLTWGAPFILPVQGSNLDSDDISSVIAFDGDKIGVLWSNQSDMKIYFAVHLDSKADTDWEPLEVALDDANLGAVADDHLNIKMMSGGAGELYATTKTGLSASSATSIYLLKRAPSGVWTNYVVAKKPDNYTRPIVILDEENRDLYIFASSNGKIHKKQVSLDNINFPSGSGSVFIQDTGNQNINDPTSSKQNVNSMTGLLVLASDRVSRNYYHNYIALRNSGRPTITSFTPTSGPVGARVTITGNNFFGVKRVNFNGAIATNFGVDSNTQISAAVPPGATTGKISVANVAGVTASADDFTVTTSTPYALMVNVLGSGRVDLNPSGGTYDAGAVVTLTATPAVGYQFAGWSGDLNGSTNPVTIMMTANKNVTAAFIASDGSGQVVHEETQTGGSVNSSIAATSASLTAAGGHLYLAAIASKPNRTVRSVSGLGLNWTLVQAQCASRNQTGVEIWMAMGTPGGAGVVTAAFEAAPLGAAIAVSRYSGVDAANPIGRIISGNTNGAKGACSGGLDNASYSFDFNTTVNGALVYGAVAMRNREHAPGAGYTERAEIVYNSGGDAAAVAIQDRSIIAAATATFEGSFSSAADWAIVAMEIKPPFGVSGVDMNAADKSITVGSPRATIYQLEQNHPNPFNPATSISYRLLRATAVRLTICNIHGQTVSAPVNGLQSAGTYMVDWQAVDAQGRPLPSGVYFYRLEAGSHIVTRRMTLVR
jgi:uncharacterized repeat protein (TIGR02543 family)